MNDSMAEEISRISGLLNERRYGKYRAFVIDNKDPEKRGRVRLLIPSVLGDAETGWALPCFPFGGGESYGWFAVPEKEAQVWAEFEEGDISRPIWTGTFWQREADVPKKAAKSLPTTRIFQTPSGHTMQFDDKDKKIIIEDTHGNKIEMDSSGVTIKGTQIMLGGDGGEALIMGESFMSVFNSHTHTCPGGPSPAPSSPPLPPGMTAVQLSRKVTTT
ncbi:MAG: phage baseplate assembly protein V [Betaproteobacteria bacterium]|nr:phage baseplate assembly protein V [Betaproteobacteria bacterium]